jgi:hypothetical protein
MISARLTLGWHYVIRRVAGGLTVGEGSEKKIHCENNTQKVRQKITSATADVENVALLTECTLLTLWSSCMETKHQFFSS